MATPAAAMRGVFYVGVMLPMWASYIVNAYAWTMILSRGGLVYWVADHLGLGGALEAILALPIVAAWWLTRGTEDASGSSR